MLQERQDPVLRFGVFDVNLPARELRKHGVRIRLPGQPFCILSILLEKPGKVITREDIQQRLWASDTFVDFEHSLNSAIKKLRAALGDSPESPRYIETIPRVGYRFIAPVALVSPVAPFPVEVSAVISRSTVTTPTVTEAGKRRWPILLPVFTALIVTAGAYFAWSHFRGGTQPQSKIANESLARGSAATNSGDQPALSSKFAEANDLYLKGMYFWNKRTVAGFQQAIEDFQQATKLDPNSALAYSGLANSYTLLASYSSSSATFYVPQARAAAFRALEIDPNLAEAHTALALIVQNHDWDWQTSEKEYRRAIELNPNYATAHHWYAEHLMWLGRFDEALRESERARQLDPLSLIIAADHGAILYYSRQYDRAIEHLRPVLRKDPGFRRTGIVVYAYVEKGMFAKARAYTETLSQNYGKGAWYWSIMTYIYGREGQLEAARRKLEELEQLNRRQELDPATMLWARLGIGDKEEALADLEKAYAEHYSFLTSLKVEPAFDPLRSDPRFQDLLRRVGLADSISATGASTPKP